MAFCTNYYPFSYVFSSCTSLYEWLSNFFSMGLRHAHFWTNYYPYSYWCSSCTFLYEWLSISFLMGFRHADFCTNEYPFIFEYVFVKHIFVRSTIHIFVIRFTSCTFLYEWLSIFIRVSSFTFLYEWLSIFFLHSCTSWTFLYEWISISLYMHFPDAHFWTNDYRFLLCGFSSFTFFYEWLSIFFIVFCHIHLCTNDYLFSISFQCSSVKRE